MIHPTAIIDKTVILGSNVTIEPYAIVRGNVAIGNGSYIGSHVAIGYSAEHSTNKYELNYKESNGIIEIGSGVVIREFTQISSPLKISTKIGDNVYVMGHCYIAHDCQIENDVTLSNGVTLGGWVRIFKGANLGLSAAVHQYSTIGHYAMVAAGATVVKDIMPLVKYIPDKCLSLNTYAICKWDLPLEGEQLSDVMACEFYQGLLKEWLLKRDGNRKVY